MRINCLNLLIQRKAIEFISILFLDALTGSNCVLILHSKGGLPRGQLALTNSPLAFFYLNFFLTFFSTLGNFLTVRNPPYGEKCENLPFFDYFLAVFLDFL